MNRLKIGEQLEVSFYEFSEDIICVKVNHKGRDLGAFCSHRTQFCEWDEKDVRMLAENHVNQFLQNVKEQHNKRRKQLSTGVELEYYSHSDDMMCVNAFRDGKEISSFCTDRLSFQEWMEDEELLEQVVMKQVIN